MTDFDPTPYTRPPVVDARSGYALAVGLLTAYPKDPTDGVRRTGKALRKATVALQAARSAAQSTARAPDTRAADTAIDNAWGALHDRLTSYASLPADRYPRAASARATLDAVFGAGGRTFLTLAYKAEWTESEDKLARIAVQGLQASIDDVAGADFLAEVKRCHAEYGEALGITKAAAAPVDAALADPLRAVAKAIADYSFQVAAMADGTAATLKRVRAALKPIDDHRVEVARRGDDADAEPRARPRARADARARSPDPGPVPDLPDA